MSQMLTNINQFGSEAILQNIEVVMKEQLSDYESDDSQKKISWKNVADNIKRRSSNLLGRRTLDLD
jgi:gamma-glutamyltranspeptidase